MCEFFEKKSFESVFDRLYLAYLKVRLFLLMSARLEGRRFEARGA